MKENISWYFPQRPTLCKQYLLCMAITMLVLSIARVLVIIILISNVKQFHDTKPQLNILNVEPMHGYPHYEWDSILCYFNIDKVNARGANWNRHFLTLILNLVHHEPNNLTTDIYQITNQYRMQGLTHLHSQHLQESYPRPTNKYYSEINFNVKVQCHKSPQTVIDGIVSIFSSPHSLHQTSKSVNKVDFHTSILESKFFTTHIDEIIRWMEVVFQEM